MVGGAKADPISGGIDAPISSEVSNEGILVQMCRANGNSVVSSAPSIQEYLVLKETLLAAQDFCTL